MRIIHGSIILCLLFLFTICQLTSPSRVRNTACIFINNVEFLIILCRRSNRLIYWWPSKSKINEVHNYSNVTLYSYRGIFGRIYNHYSLNHQVNYYQFTSSNMAQPAGFIIIILLTIQVNYQQFTSSNMAQPKESIC